MYCIIIKYEVFYEHDLCKPYGIEISDIYKKQFGALEIYQQYNL